MADNSGRSARAHSWWTALALAGVVLGAGCSVTTPRDGSALPVAARSAARSESSQPSDSTEPVAVETGDVAPTGGGEPVRSGAVEAGTANPSGGAASGPRRGAGTAAGSGGAPGGAATSAAGSAGPGRGATRGSGPSTAPTTGGASGTGGAAAPPNTPGAAGAAVGVTKDTITITAIASFSGPYGAIINPMWEEGFGTWLKDINQRGGIHGRRIVVKKVDHAETVEGGIAACKEAVSNGTLMAIVGSGTGEGNDSAAACLDKAGFLNFGWLSNPDGRWRSSFSLVPSSTDFGTSLPGFIGHAMGDQSKKIGIIHASPAAFTVMKDAYLKEAKALGMKVVAVERIEPSQTSYVPQLLRLRDAGAQHVTIIAGIEAIGVLRDAAAVNYRPRWSGGGWTYDVQTMAARNTAEGVHGLRLQATVDSPAFAEFERKRDQYGQSNASSSDGESFIFYGEGLVLEQVLKAAGPNPNPATVRAAMESFRNFETGVFPPITWAPGKVLGTHASWPAVCCRSDWRWKTLGPPQERWGANAASPQALGRRDGTATVAGPASRPVRRPVGTSPRLVLPAGRPVARF